MWKKAIVAFGLLVLFEAAPIGAKDAKGVVADVARTMGAADAKSIQYSGSGYFFFFGQSYRPTDPWPKFALKSYTRALDYESGASEERFTIAQAEDGERGGGFIPIKGVLNQDAFLSGDYAWTTGSAPALDFGPPFLAEVRQVELAMTPVGWARAAMAANPTLASKKINGKQMNVVSFTLKGKYKVNGYVNDQNLLERVETWLPQPILGDLPLQIDYSDYKDFSGLKFPARISQEEGGFPVLDLTVDEVLRNTPTNIRVPEAVRNAAPAPLRAVSQQLADGVWILRAGTQSLGVEFKDYTAIIDGAGNEDRSLAVMAEMKRLAPDKPVRYVINTHHHLDHAGGLRTFVAEGATIITSEMNKPYYEKIFRLPHTLNPDELAKNPKPAAFITVKDKYVLTDGVQSVELYTLPGNTHSPDMLIAYVPRSKTVVEGDIYNPTPLPRPDAPPPQSVNLVGDKELLRDNLQKLKLDVQQFVGLHANGPTPFADLEKEIAVEHEQLQALERASK